MSAVKLTTAVMLAAVLPALALPSSAQVALRPGFAAPAPAETRFVANEVVLSTRPNVAAETLTAIARRNRLTRMESQDAVLTGLRFYRWRIDSGASVAAAIRSLVRERLIVSAQPNYVYRLQQDRAVDPHDQEALQYALGSLRIPQAHRLATGNHILIAVIDSEIDATHPDLEGSISASYNTTDIQLTPHTHGTAMAGAIAAHHKLTGTAPAASLLAVRAFGGTEAGEDGTTFRIMKGLNWAAAQGARVVNMSFAGPPDPAVHEALSAAHARGIVLVAASGNAGPKSPPLYPAAEPQVIAVTAVDAQNRLFGLASGGKHLAVAAPGVDVLVPAPDAGLAFTTGTSVAAAEVSGIAALVLERAPSLSPDAVREILIRSAEHLGTKGRNREFGAGLVDAVGAVEAAPTWPAPPATH
jgi:subtilisin family serine protease